MKIDPKCDLSHKLRIESKKVHNQSVYQNNFFSYAQKNSAMSAHRQKKIRKEVELLYCQVRAKFQTF